MLNSPSMKILHKVVKVQESPKLYSASHFDNKVGKDVELEWTSLIVAEIYASGEGKVDKVVLVANDFGFLTFAAVSCPGIDNVEMKR